MIRLIHFIAVAMLFASTGGTSLCCASIETEFNSSAIVEKMTATDDNDRQPQRPHVEQEEKLPEAIPFSLNGNAGGGMSSGMLAALLTTVFDIQLGPDHKIYLQSCIHWPIPPTWKMLKVPICQTL